MNSTRPTPIEPGYPIQLTANWADGLRLKGYVVLAKTAEGILAQPHPNVNRDDIFATRLSVRPGYASTAPDITEVNGDDLLISPFARSRARHDDPRDVHSRFAAPRQALFHGQSLIVGVLAPRPFPTVPRSEPMSPPSGGLRSRLVVDESPGVHATRL
jgi:hypothetical protein